MPGSERGSDRASITNLIDGRGQASEGTPANTQNPSPEDRRTQTENVEDEKGDVKPSGNEPSGPETSPPDAAASTSTTENTPVSSSSPRISEKTEKTVPAWMREPEEVQNRYDRYVPRVDSRRRGDGRVAEVRQDPRYAKYLRQDQEERRIRRPDDEDEADHKRRRPDVATQFDDRRQGTRKSHGGRAGPAESEENGDEAGGDEEEETRTNEEPVEAQPYSRLATSVQSTQHYHTFQSHIANKENKDINSIVRSHYNQRTIQSKMQGSRTKSPIYKLRNFNNAVKYMLLGNYVRKNPNPGLPTVILDMCCGKGGDLNKAEFVGADQYVGIDISDASVKEAFHRYRRNKARFIPRDGGRAGQRDSRKYNFEACFATGDCFQQSIPEILEPNFPGIVNGLFPVDCVLIQFSMHYSFESEERVRTMLNNVSKSLRPGGTFVGTIPSSDFIRDKIVNKDFVPGTSNKFGNELYSVTFERPPPSDGIFRPPFGNKYDYFLKDAVDNVPEYVVPFEVFRLMCEEVGLTLRYKKNFIDIFNQEIPKYFHKLNRNLVDGMKRADGRYGAEGAEKEAVSFYLGFAFEKLG